MIRTHLRLELGALLRCMYVHMGSPVIDSAQIRADATCARHLCRAIPYRHVDLSHLLKQLETGTVVQPDEICGARRVLRDAADRL